MERTRLYEGWLRTIRSQATLSSSEPLCHVCVPPVPTPRHVPDAEQFLCRDVSYGCASVKAVSTQTNAKKPRQQLPRGFIASQALLFKPFDFGDGSCVFNERLWTNLGGSL
jgi:hypothetical protein